MQVSVRSHYRSHLSLFTGVSLIFEEINVLVNLAPVGSSSCTAENYAQCCPLRAAREVPTVSESWAVVSQPRWRDLHAWKSGWRKGWQRNTNTSFPVHILKIECGTFNSFLFEEHSARERLWQCTVEERTEIRVLIPALPVISHGTTAIRVQLQTRRIHEFKQKRIYCHC